MTVERWDLGKGECNVELHRVTLKCWKAAATLEIMKFPISKPWRIVFNAWPSNEEYISWPPTWSNLQAACGSSHSQPFNASTTSHCRAAGYWQVNVLVGKNLLSWSSLEIRHTPSQLCYSLANLPRHWDTIIITQDLGIDYLWIDSLCIYLDRHRTKYRGNLRLGPLFSEGFRFTL